MRSPWGLLSLAVLAACGAEPAQPGDEAEVLAQAGGEGDGKADNPTAAPGQLVRLTIEHGAVDGTDARPNLVAYLPAGLDTSHGLNVVVFLHGHLNCASNVVGTRNSPCRAGYPARQAYSLAAQLEASKKNAILLVPELAYDVADSGEFALAEEYRFAWMLWDASAALADRLGGAGYWDIDQVVVASHSGGYRSAAAIVTVGGFDVKELWLLDSLYGRDGDFEGWIAGDHDALAATPRERRFADVYTASAGAAGTLPPSQAMATRLAPSFPAAAMLDDRSTATLAAPQYDRGLLFKRSGLAHDDVPRYYFRKLLESSSLPAKP